MKDLNIPWMMLGVLMAVNFGISWFNARTVGLMWVETKVCGGWSRFMAWMGWIMSASGFTWCYLIVLMLGSYYAQPLFLKPDQQPWLTAKGVEAGFALGYLLIIPGILFSGLMIWIDSLMQAWRQRTVSSMATAAWNTFAQVHNTYEAFSGISGAFESIGDFLKSDDSDDSGGKLGMLAILIIVLIVLFAILGGIFTTLGIVNHYAATRPLEARESAMG